MHPPPPKQKQKQEKKRKKKKPQQHQQKNHKKTNNDSQRFRIGETKSDITLVSMDHCKGLGETYKMIYSK